MLSFELLEPLSQYLSPTAIVAVARTCKDAQKSVKLPTKMSFYQDLFCNEYLIRYLLHTDDVSEFAELSGIQNSCEKHLYSIVRADILKSKPAKFYVHSSYHLQQIANIGCLESVNCGDINRHVTVHEYYFDRIECYLPKNKNINYHLYGTITPTQVYTALKHTKSAYIFNEILLRALHSQKMRRLAVDVLASPLIIRIINISQSRRYDPDGPFCASRYEQFLSILTSSDVAEIVAHHGICSWLILPDYMLCDAPRFNILAISVESKFKDCMFAHCIIKNLMGINLIPSGFRFARWFIYRCIYEQKLAKVANLLRFDVETVNYITDLYRNYPHCKNSYLVSAIMAHHSRSDLEMAIKLLVG